MRARNSLLSPRALAAYQRGPRAANGVSTQGGALMLYGPIGDYWGEGVVASDVVAALAAMPPGPLTVRINSPGGDVWEGMAIRNAIMHHTGGPVTMIVDGIAASAASYIAIAAPVVRMHTMAMLMIHRASTVAWGMDSDLRAAADLLAKIDGQMAADYAAKTGRDLEEVRAALDAETYYTADEALAFGLCNEIIPDADRNTPADPDPETRAGARMRLQARLRIAARGPV